MRFVLLLAAVLAGAPLAGQAPPPDVDPLHRPFDALLDTNVRDGLVYYNALRQQRGALDRYVASIGAVSPVVLEGWSRERQMAFWLNAYDAFVLRTVIDNYPIRGRSPAYPPGSIRQIPGAFERQTFRVAGRSVTLDQIETVELERFGDPRLFLAIGRGALGSGRLRSEAFSANRLEAQLASAAAEIVTRREMAFIDRLEGTLAVSAIFSWRQDAFSRAYADAAPAPFASRTPIERGIVALVSPHLVDVEAEFLARNEFRVVFTEFDWRLNDLTGR